MNNLLQEQMQKSLQEIRKIRKLFYAEFLELKKRQRALIAGFTEKVAQRKIEKIRKQLQ